MPSHLQRAAVSINRVRSKVSHQSWKKLFLRRRRDHQSGTPPGAQEGPLESPSRIQFSLVNSLFATQLSNCLQETSSCMFHVLQSVAVADLREPANKSSSTFHEWGLPLIEGKLLYNLYLSFLEVIYIYIIIHIYIIIYIIYRVIVYQYFWWLVSRLFTGQSHFGDSLKKSPSHFGD